MGDSPPSLDELLAGIQGLLDKQEDEREDDPGEGNIACEACNACYNCRFCTGCDSCEDCTYCEDCVDCEGCTQSKRCIACVKGSYLEDCRGCQNSRYLALCVDCKDCLYCLGCVGLEGAEYHVLNEKVSKKEFYKILNRVREDLDARVERGWRPELIGLVSIEESFEEEEEPEPEVHDEEAEAFLRRPTRAAPKGEPEPEADRSPSVREPEADEEDEAWLHERTPVRFEKRSSPPARDLEDEETPLWEDAPASRASRSSSRLSRGRRPEPAERKSLWDDDRGSSARIGSRRRPPPSSARPAAPPRSSRPEGGDKARSKSKRREPTRTGSGSTSARVGRRPSRAREVTQSGAAPWQSADPEAPQARRKSGDSIDPFGEESMGLGQVDPSRPEPAASAPASREAKGEEPPPKQRGGLRRGRRPPRKS